LIGYKLNDAAAVDVRSYQGAPYVVSKR